MERSGPTDVVGSVAARPLRVGLSAAAFGAVLVLAIVSITWELWAYPNYGGRSHGLELLQVVSGGAVYVAALVLAVRRPQSRVWLLVLWFCACGFAQDLGAPSRLLVTIELLFGELATPAFVHLVLAYPSGHLRSRAARVVVHLGYVVALVGGLIDSVVNVLADRQGTSYASYFHVAAKTPHMRDVLLTIGGFLNATRLVLALVGLLLLLVAARRASSLARPLRIPLYVVAAASTIVYLLIAAQQTNTGWSATTEFLLFLALQTLVPVALVLGLLAERRGQAVVADLVVELEHAPIDRLAQVIGRALRDPDVEVRFVAGDGTRLTSQGEPITEPIPAGRAALVVHGADGDLAEIVHDATLADQPQLLRAVASAAHFAIDRARLQAVLLAQVDELRSSRERIVDSASAERRRIERNLHDGAQQQLLAVGMRLDDVRRRLRRPGGDAQPEVVGALDEAVESLRATITELQALARGVHPPILTARGLVPAVRSLLDRVPTDIDLVAGEHGRLDPSIEAAAYYVVSEGIGNALRHAAAETIGVRIERDDRTLTVGVTDDGCGGADPTSDGLRLLGDRVAAVGGTLTIVSPTGRGTTVLARLPCG